MADQPKKPVGGRPTKAGIAAACAAAILICTPFIAQREGKRNVGYLDIAKVATDCYGHTGKDVVVGRYNTDTQCTAKLSADISVHMQAVVACASPLADHPQQLAAATSLAFNIGGPAFCRSTAGKRFAAGNLRGGCDALGSSYEVTLTNGRRVRVKGYVFAGGREVAGLASRRDAERALCLRGL